MTQPTPPHPAPPALAAIDKPARLVSLDAFRGFVVASMLLVNLTWGEAQWGTGLGQRLALQLAHVDWNDPRQGATFTDLVFPWFLFIMGAAMPLSMASGRGRSVPAGRRALAALRRAAVLYLLGVLLTHAGAWLDRPAAWTDLLSWNILQLIALAYVAVVVVGLLPRWAWWAFPIAVLLARWASLTLTDAAWLRDTLASGPIPLQPRSPEHPIGPGTFTHFDDLKRYLCREHIDPAAGVWPAIDRRLLGWIGMAHQWLPCAAIATAGALAVDWLMRARNRPILHAATLMAAGAAALALAALLQWGYQPTGGGLLAGFTVPYSKWLFTPAYCLLAAGSGAVLLAACFLGIDVARQRWLAEPWRTFGVNAIALYLGAELSFKLAFSRWLLPLPDGAPAALPGAINAHVAARLPRGELVAWADGALTWDLVSGLAFAVLWLAGWWLVCRWMDRRGLYLRV